MTVWGECCQHPFTTLHPSWPVLWYAVEARKVSDIIHIFKTSDL